jgi:hypothetical protein
MLVFYLFRNKKMLFILKTSFNNAYCQEDMKLLLMFFIEEIFCKKKNLIIFFANMHYLWRLFDCSNKRNDGSTANTYEMDRTSMEPG